MQNTPTRSKFGFILAAGLFFLLALLLVIPATSQAIFGLLGIRTEAKTAYNGFEPFTPFVPGYFPDDFDITYVAHDAILGEDMDTYTETYASETHFFKLIESQGPGVPPLVPDRDVAIQEQPAALDNHFDAKLLDGDTLDLSKYDTSEAWKISVVLKEITVTVVTNLPQDETVLIAEGLVPAICTTKPTEPAN